MLPEGGECACPQAEPACQIPLPLYSTALAGEVSTAMIDVMYEAGAPIVLELGGA